MINPRWARDIWRQAIGAGCRLTLHSRDPGRSGQSARLGDPIDLPGTALKITNASISNPQDLDLGLTSASGTLRFLGLWTSSNTFIMGLPTKVDYPLTEGQPLRIPRSGIEVDIRAR